jgi:hypothetical protein
MNVGSAAKGYGPKRLFAAIEQLQGVCRVKVAGNAVWFKGLRYAPPEEECD